MDKGLVVTRREEGWDKGKWVKGVKCMVMNGNVWKLDL